MSSRGGRVVSAWRSECGNMLPLVVVSALVLFAVLAFSIDQGIAYAAKVRQENALDAARAACMDASFALVAKNADDPGALVAERVVRTLRDQGCGGSIVVWFYEAPAEDLPVSERLWAIGMQVRGEAETVFARGYGIEGLPVASWRVMTAVPYAGERAWRPARRSCGRFEEADGADPSSMTFTSVERLEGFPREMVEAVEAALPDGPQR